MGRAWSSIGMAHSLLVELGWGIGRGNGCKDGAAVRGEVPVGPDGRGMTGRPPPVGGSRVGGVAGVDGPGVAGEVRSEAGTSSPCGRVGGGRGSCWEAAVWASRGAAGAILACALLGDEAAARVWRGKELGNGCTITTMGG